jgi:hypothetical protein
MQNKVVKVIVQERVGPQYRYVIFHVFKWEILATMIQVSDVVRGPLVYIRFASVCAMRFSARGFKHEAMHNVAIIYYHDYDVLHDHNVRAITASALTGPRQACIEPEWSWTLLFLEHCIILYWDLLFSALTQSNIFFPDFQTSRPEHHCPTDIVCRKMRIWWIKSFTLLSIFFSFSENEDEM